LTSKLVNDGGNLSGKYPLILSIIISGLAFLFLGY